MARQSNIEIRITGERGKRSLSPETVGVSYLIDSLNCARNLIAAMEGTDDDPVVVVEEGSLALRFTLAASLAAVLSEQLHQVKDGGALSRVHKHLRRALEGLQKLARRAGDTVHLQREGRPILTIDSDTVFNESDAIWVHSEVYLRGKVNNAGGVSNPNLHVVTDDLRFGKLLISATKEQLAGDDKNRLYKPQTLRVEIMQDALTGDFDLSSASLLDFVETQEIGDTDTYLDELIGRAKGSWSAVGDAEEWLAQIRGYEN